MAICVLDGCPTNQNGVSMSVCILFNYVPVLILYPEGGDKTLYLLTRHDLHLIATTMNGYEFLAHSATVPKTYKWELSFAMKCIPNVHVPTCVTRAKEEEEPSDRKGRTKSPPSTLHATTHAAKHTSLHSPHRQTADRSHRVGHRYRFGLAPCTARL